MHIADATQHIQAQLQRELVVRQYEELSRFGNGETAVFTERAYGTTEVGFFVVALVIQLLQVGLRRQRRHGVVALDNFRHQRRFGVANNHNATATGFNIVLGQLQVVEEGCAGGGHAAGFANVAQHIGVDEVGRHFAQAHRALLGAGALTH